MTPETLLTLLAGAPGPDHAAATAVIDRASQVIRPTGALARLDAIAAWLASWQRTATPAVRRPHALVFAGDHGVATEGVSAYPSAVTPAMRDAISGGLATINAIGSAVGATVTVIDVGVGDPTGNLRTHAALSPERFAISFAAGRRAVSELETDLLVLGEVGIGNTTPAAAVSAALLGGDPGDWVGSGTGVQGDALEAKRTVVRDAVGRLHPGLHPLEVLREVGGAELVAMAGAALEARLRSIPVVLDGVIATAALLPLHEVASNALDHVIAGHRSPEPAHGRMLEHMGKAPLLDLGMRLGEGSGALAAVPLIKVAAAVVTDVATFAEIGLG